MRLRPGVLYMLGAAFFFSVMAVLVKLAARIPAQEVVFVRSALNVLFTLALIRRYRAPVVGRHVGWLLLRGTFGYLALSCHFFAIQRLPLADAITLHNASPVLVALLAPPVLGEPGGPRAVGLAGLGLLGVAILLRPTGEVPLLPGLAALSGAFLSCLAYLTIRSLGRKEHPLTVVLWFPMISVFASLGPTLATFVRPSLAEAFVLVGVGVATTAAQLLLTVGLRLERASVATSLSYTSIVFALIFGATAFGEIPDATTVAGSLIIVAAAVLVARARPREPA